MRKFLRNIAFNLILLPLLRLAYKIELLTFKRAVSLRGLLLLKLNYLIRVVKPDAHLEGYDEDLDKAIHIAALRLLEPEVFGIDDDFPSEDIPDQLRATYDELNARYSEIKTDADSIVQEMAEKQSVRQILSDYWLIRHFSETIRKNEGIAQYNLSRAKKMGFRATPLTTRDLYSLERTVRKEIADLRDTIADRKALKIDISTSEITVLASAASSLFLVSGYLYNHLLLGEFGVDVSKFFTLSDFVASSISTIGYTFSAAAFATLVTFLRVHSFSRKSAAQMRYGQSKLDYRGYFLTGICLIGTVVGYYSDIYQFYNTGFLAAICLSVFWIPRVCEKYFKKPRSALFIVFFFVCFSAHLWASLGKTINEYRYEELQKIKVFDIKLKDSLSLPTSDFVLIAANSGYYFLLDQNRKAHIISKGQVEYLERRPTKGGSNPFDIFPGRKDLD